MQPVRVGDPEFHSLRLHTKPAPMWRAGDVIAGEFLFHRCQSLLKRFITLHRMRLHGRPRAEAAFTGARDEVGIRLGVAYLFGGTADPDLSLDAFPVKIQLCMGMLQKPAPFTARQVGIENKAACIEGLQKDHADRWMAIFIDRGQRHGVWVVDFGCLCLGDPVLENVKRIVTVYFKNILRHAGTDFLSETYNL